MKRAGVVCGVWAAVVLASVASSMAAPVDGNAASLAPEQDQVPTPEELVALVQARVGTTALADKLAGKKLLFIGDSMMRQDMGYVKCALEGKEVDVSDSKSCDQKTHDQLHSAVHTASGRDVSLSFFWAPSMWHAWQFFTTKPFHTDEGVCEDPDAEIASADVVFVAVAGCSDKTDPNADQLPAFFADLKAKAGNKLVLRLPGAQNVTHLQLTKPCEGPAMATWMCRGEFSNDVVEQFGNEAKQAAHAQEIRVVDTFGFTKGDAMHSKFQNDDGACHYLGVGRYVAELFLRIVERTN